MRTAPFAALLLTTLATVAVAPPASAHPNDLWAFTPNAPNLCVCPPPPYWFVATITQVTGQDAAGFFVGRGTCAGSIGEACTPPIPAVIPFGPLAGAVTTGVSCAILAATGPWPAGPGIYVAQDVSATPFAVAGNAVIDAGLPGSPDVAVGPVVGIGTMVDQTLLTAGGFYAAGLPLHVIATHPGFPLTPASATLTVTVGCALF